MILPKKSLRGIERLSHPIKSREGSVTLERNERAIDFSPDVIADLKDLITGFILRAYPEMDEAYDALSEWTGFSTRELLFTEGADGALFRVFATYVSEGDEVVIVSPSYAMYPVYCDMFGAVKRELTFDENLNLPFEKILDEARPGTRMIALVNPNQPIEIFIELDQMRELAKRCAEHDIILLVDAAYDYFCSESATPLINEFDNVIIARTFSKAFGLAGLRIGYLIAPENLCTHLRALKPIYEINHLHAAIVTYFLKKRPDVMRGYVKDVDAGRIMLRNFFEQRGCTVNGKHSNTILVGLPGKVSATEIVAGLRKQDWLIRAETKPPSLNHLRITLGPPDLMQGLCEKLAVFF